MTHWGVYKLSHLIVSYGIPVHYAGSATHNRQVKLRDEHILRKETTSSTPQIHFHDLELPTYNVPTPDPNASRNNLLHLRPLRLAISQMRHPMFELLQQLATKFRRLIVIHDTLMASVVQDIRSTPNAEVYTFHATSTFTLFFNAWQSMTDKPFQLANDIASLIAPFNEGYNTTSEFADFIVSQSKLSLEIAFGRINNTCRLMEGRCIELFQKLPMNAKIRYFPLGPFNPIEKKKQDSSKDGGKRHKCLQWLDHQEKGSVIYVSFGTVISMTDEQITELAIGLERSGEKFLWVLRSPDRGDIFAKGDDNVHTRRHAGLPEGYEERVQNRGLIVTEWAPQLDILAHPSTIAFMSHCGWASCVESISMGVAIAAWPITSDQPKNSVMLTEILKVGMLVRPWERQAELVKSDTVENVVRILMTSDEGDVIRKRAAELGCDVRASQAVGGASRAEMDSFIAHITR